MDAALEYMADQASTCSGCGFPRAESMAVGRDNAYDATPVACHACAAKDRAERAFREQSADAFPGLRWHVFER